MITVKTIECVNIIAPMVVCLSTLVYCQFCGYVWLLFVLPIQGGLLVVLQDSI